MTQTLQSHFNDLQRDPGTLVAYSALISGVMAFVAARGLQGGVELVSKIFMPVLLIMFIILAFGSNTLKVPQKVYGGTLL